MMKNTAPINHYIYGLMLIGGLFTIAGCETEQKSENNNAMVGYAKEQAKAQAEFAVQERLEEVPLSEKKVVIDGTKQSISGQK